MAKNQPLSSVRMACGHFILVPGYASKTPTDYPPDVHCAKCEEAKKVGGKK